MAYSTEAQLKNNVKILEQTFTAIDLTALFVDREALAAKTLKVDCGKYIDFSTVPDDDTTDVVNLLSQYKTAEYALVRIAGIKRRQNQNDDIEYWIKQYDDLKEKVANNQIPVELSDGTDVGTSINKFRNTARPNVRPYNGYYKHGEWINNDDMEKLMGDPDDTILDGVRG